MGKGTDAPPGRRTDRTLRRVADSSSPAGPVRIAYLDEPPFFYLRPAGGPGGCDVELARTVLGRMGVADIEFVLTTFGQMIPGLIDGRWHLNMPMFVTAERAELVHFSLPVWAAGDGFIIRTGDDRDFSSYEAIAGDSTVRLTVVSGQVQHDAALAAGVPARRISCVETQEAAIEAVLDGRADASASTAPGNRAFVERAADDRLRAVTAAPHGHDDPIPLGAFSFPERSAWSMVFDDNLRAHLGTTEHLAMMRRHGFAEAELRPAIGWS
jgi:polar amino acid transport system substrate-binding protein